MRYIDLSKLELPDNWKAKADVLQAELAAAASEDERSLILKRNPVWQDLLVPLNGLSNGKCWYSEAKEIMSDKDVDHFRPKNETRNLDGGLRDGYWWLAYDPENYRFSSIYCNRRRLDKFSETIKTGGKWSYFPLFPGSYIATTKARLADEDILLLDPTDEDDPCLLTFDESGEAIPNTVVERDIERVKVSVNLYHLDHTPLQEERQKVWGRCQRFINQIEEVYSKGEISATDKAKIKFLGSVPISV